MAKLTPKQKKFCHEYMVDLNATQAAIRAGYSERSAVVIGSENLTKPDIQKYISENKQKLQEKTGITTERVLAEYAKIAFFDIRKIYNKDGNLLDVTAIDSDSAAAIAGIEVTEEKDRTTGAFTGFTRKVKISDKIRALDALGKHLGIFEKDNLQKELSINVMLTNEEVKKFDKALEDEC